MYKFTGISRELRECRGCADEGEQDSVTFNSGRRKKHRRGQRQTGRSRAVSPRVTALGWDGKEAQTSVFLRQENLDAPTPKRKHLNEKQ